MGQYSMPCYFSPMPVIGGALRRRNEENRRAILKLEQEIRDLRTAVQEAGRSTASLNEAGQYTALQRIAMLVDEGGWFPLNSLYDPGGNKDGSTGIIKGLGRINGRWTLVVASDNKKLAGAWVAGQADNLLRAGDTAKRLRIPLIYLLNCSGVKLDEQEKIYPNRRGGGAPLYHNAALNQMGIPVIVGIYGTNPAGGGYQAISSTVLVAHEDANMAVGGAGIVGGMSPKGYVDAQGAQALIDAQQTGSTETPGTVSVHYYETGFFREAYAGEEGVLAAISRFVDMLPAYDPAFFRVDDPADPLYDPEELYSLLPVNQKRAYDIYEVLARLVDASQFSEYKKGYGPEIITGLAKIDGLPVGIVANYQGLLPDYPEYKGPGAMGVGGKLYRQGLVKLNEFVVLCTRDRIPICWIQDTTGVDVGNDAERAELLGLGQSLIYSIQSSNLPMVEITLRKGNAAAHYLLGGPQGADTNAFSLGTGATEIYVMHGETAAAAMYARRLAKDQKAGLDLQPTIDKMNGMIRKYQENSRPKACARAGLVDEIVELPVLRGYLQAFVGACYQNPASICPVHQMLLPRCIREFETARPARTGGTQE